MVAGGLALRSRNGVDMAGWFPELPGWPSPSATTPPCPTASWLKVKRYRRETFLVGGYIPDHGQVRSLLVGLPDPARPGGPRFCGRVDHGLVLTTRPRCSSAPSWPWRSASSAGSRAGYATLPTAA